MKRSLPAVLAWLFLIGAVSAATPRTEEVFRRNERSILRVTTLENSSGSQATVGSGFFVTPDGMAITNYHVVAKLLWNPGPYRGAAFLKDGRSLPFQTIAVDVVHDLALIKLSIEGETFPSLAFESLTPGKGTRLYALGNPHDLGMTIVEGTYSGLMEESLLKRIHFTGSINPGMSGGPVLSQNGRVVGVCVATAGNQVGFLVPGALAKKLLDAPVQAAGVDELKLLVKEQLTAHQEATARTLFSASFSTASVGEFQAPGRLLPALRCWANTDEGKGQPYQAIHSQCETEEDILINDDLSTGYMRIMHHGLGAGSLNPFQFSSLQRYSLSKSPESWGNVFSDFSLEELTPNECANALLSNGKLTFKGNLCLRGYRDFPGLYDLTWKGVTLTDSRHALTTLVTWEGITRENAEQFLQRYLEAFSWNPTP